MSARSRNLNACSTGADDDHGPFPPRVYQAVTRRFALDIDGMHGRPHWTRVSVIGRTLAKETGADPAIVDLFAILHDSLRFNEDVDPDHGARAADFARDLQGTAYRLSPRDLATLEFACRFHSLGQVIGEPTVTTCWDADRLDIWRYDVRPDKRLLCNEVAKKDETIDWAYALSH